MSGNTRVWRRGVCASALAAVLVGSGFATQAQSVGQVEQKWRSWMAANSLTTGGIAVLQDGKVALEATLGSVQPSTPVRLASLSKAITAVCVAGLVERGALSFETLLGGALARTFARVGRPADKRLVDVTIGQLLVHRAGLAADNKEALKSYLQRNSAKETSFDSQVRLAIASSLSFVPDERFAYTNTAYLLLGAAIEEATDSSYETFCRDHVLSGLGVTTAQLDSSHRFMASYGGWAMSLADYARFYQAFAEGNPAIGPRARAWMMSPDGKSLGGGAHYGLGTFVRPTGGTANFWHWGSWLYALMDGHDGPISESWMTFAVRIGSANANAMIYFEPELTQSSARRYLDLTLSQALTALQH